MTESAKQTLIIVIVTWVALGAMTVIGVQRDRARERADRAEQTIRDHCTKTHYMLAAYARQLADPSDPNGRTDAANAFGGNLGLHPVGDEIAMCHPRFAVDFGRRSGCWLAWLVHETPERTELAYQCLAQLAHQAAAATAPEEP